MHHYGAPVMHHGEVSMKAITLRNLPPEIEKVVRKEADRQRTSINKAVISLLERKAEGHKKKRVRAKEHDDLDALAGSWTKKEAAAFDKTLTAQRPIDPELWK
jgi:tRNA(Ser,Leu) C12 N-acetylase TAN1